MRVLKLKCKSFRNLGEVEIIPCEETNVICGENAGSKLQKAKDLGVEIITAENLEL